MALSQRGYGYDYDHHPSAGGYRGRIGGYRGTTGGYLGTERGRGYDGAYQSRARTDAGDPFGDRQSGTPIRVIRGSEQRGTGRDRGRDHRGARPARGYDTGGWFW